MHESKTENVKSPLLLLSCLLNAMCCQALTYEMYGLEFDEWKEKMKPIRIQYTLLFGAKEWEWERRRSGMSEEGERTIVKNAITLLF